jgi:zinc transporter 1/2/3
MQVLVPTFIVTPLTFVQLFTHAQLMFTNECLGRLAYESTTAAVFLAGLFLSFLVDYLGARFIMWRQNKKVTADEEIRSTPTPSESKGGFETPARAGSANLVSTDDHEGHTHMHAADHSSHVHMHGHAEEKVGVIVLEAGIIFHSLRESLDLAHFDGNC